MDLRQLLAVILAKTLAFDAITPEQWTMLAEAKPSDFTADELAAVTAIARQAYRAARADEATKTSAETVALSGFIGTLDDEGSARASAAEKLARADTLSADPEPTDPPEGGEPTDPPAGGEPVLVGAGAEALPTSNPTGTTAGSPPAAEWKPGDPFRQAWKAVTAARMTADGAAPGAPITNESLIRDMAQRFESLLVGGGPVEYQPMGVVASYNLPEGDLRRVNMKNSAWQNQQIIDSAIEQQTGTETVKPGGVTAAIWCGPVAVSFAIDVVGRGGRPIYDSLPKVPAARGRFKFRPDLAVARTADTPPFIEWDPDTNSPDCASFTCVSNSCETTEREKRLRFFRHCFEHTNTQEITDPEGLAAVMRRNNIQFERWLEQVYMATFQDFALASSTYFSWGTVSGNTVTTPTGYGSIPDLATLLFACASEVGWDGRYERGAYSAYVPEGLFDWLMLDEMAAASDTPGKVATFMAAMANRKMKVYEYLDDPVLGRNPIAGPVYNQPAGATYAANTTQTVTTASNTTLVVEDSSVLAVGQSVSGTGIAALTKIASITDATHVVLTVAATATGTVTGTFTGTLIAPTSPVALLKNPLKKFRLFLIPNGGVPVMETGALEIGPDRVTQAKCDIVRTVLTRREAPFIKDENRPVFSIDVGFKANGARAGGITPWA